MMNVQNPSFPHQQQQYPGHTAYAQVYGHHSNHMVGTGTGSNQPNIEAMAQYPSDFGQPQMQQPVNFPNTPQRLSHFSQQAPGQPGQQIPPHLYQQFQQQQQQATHQQQQQQQQHAVPGFVRPQSRDNIALAQAQSQRQSPTNSNSGRLPSALQGNAPNTPVHQRQLSTQMQASMNSMLQQSPNAGQGSMNGAVQMAKSAAPPLSPQALAREEERVSTLLEINSMLIQEVINLQTQGKAGAQTPASPTTATGDATPNSPADPVKKHAASQEYNDCMRRLQANLGYLAQVADANKKPGVRPPLGPQIMIPPPHLNSIFPLYQKLKDLFPEASQSTLNKAMAVANAQRTAAGTGPTPTPAVLSAS